MPIGPALSDTPLALDNDIFTHWRNGQVYVLREIAEHFRRLQSPPALTSMTIFEALWGIEDEEKKAKITKIQAQQYKDRIKELSESCIVLPWEQKAAAITAHIYPRLTGHQLQKHWRDLFIAATVLAHGYGLATRNIRDFKLVADLSPDLLRVAEWRP
ncbi:MAG: type II toxin-antitoxin system VapC family toxin [Acidobacteria bacterium]|nr:type II toxin-antitoxin system VapC family toxin [Acidobacteriota bacterium]MCA1632473.1 type II toxin-antitoxin system VapC family toxin [Acidobacteriota bacterium]MCA1640826.1 type II toxin-antitoxin system VapC family toxin [Acidobacteriota bacterium]